MSWRSSPLIQPGGERRCLANASSSALSLKLRVANISNVDHKNECVSNTTTFDQLLRYTCVRLGIETRPDDSTSNSGKRHGRRALLQFNCNRINLPTTPSQFRYPNSSILWLSQHAPPAFRQHRNPVACRLRVSILPCKRSMPTSGSCAHQFFRSKVSRPAPQNALDGEVMKGQMKR